MSPYRSFFYSHSHSCFSTPSLVRGHDPSAFTGNSGKCMQCSVRVILSPLRVTILLPLQISLPTLSQCFRGKFLYFQHKLMQMVWSIKSRCLYATESVVEAHAMLRSTQSCWTSVVSNLIIWQRCSLSNVIIFREICAGTGRLQVLLKSGK